MIVDTNVKEGTEPSSPTATAQYYHAQPRGDEPERMKKYSEQQQQQKSNSANLAHEYSYSNNNNNANNTINSDDGDKDVGGHPNQPQPVGGELSVFMSPPLEANSDVSAHEKGKIVKSDGQEMMTTCVGIYNNVPVAEPSIPPADSAEQGELEKQLASGGALAEGPPRMAADCSPNIRIPVVFGGALKGFSMEEGMGPLQSPTRAEDEYANDMRRYSSGAGTNGPFQGPVMGYIVAIPLYSDPAPLPARAIGGPHASHPSALPVMVPDQAAIYVGACDQPCHSYAEAVGIPVAMQCCSYCKSPTYQDGRWHGQSLLRCAVPSAAVMEGTGNASTLGALEAELFQPCLCPSFVHRGCFRKKRSGLSVFRNSDFYECPDCRFTYKLERIMGGVRSTGFTAPESNASHQTHLPRPKKMGGGRSDAERKELIMRRIAELGEGSVKLHFYRRIFLLWTCVILAFAGAVAAVGAIAYAIDDAEREIPVLCRLLLTSVSFEFATEERREQWRAEYKSANSPPVWYFYGAFGLFVICATLIVLSAMYYACCSASNTDGGSDVRPPLRSYFCCDGDKDEALAARRRQRDVALMRLEESFANNPNRQNASPDAATPLCVPETPNLQIQMTNAATPNRGDISTSNHYVVTEGLRKAVEESWGQREEEMVSYYEESSGCMGVFSCFRPTSFGYRDQRLSKKPAAMNTCTQQQQEQEQPHQQAHEAGHTTIPLHSVQQNNTIPHANTSNTNNNNDNNSNIGNYIAGGVTHNTCVGPSPVYYTRSEPCCLQACCCPTGPASAPRSGNCSCNCADCNLCLCCCCNSVACDGGDCCDDCDCCRGGGGGCDCGDCDCKGGCNCSGGGGDCGGEGALVILLFLLLIIVIIVVVSAIFGLFAFLISRTLRFSAEAAQLAYIQALEEEEHIFVLGINETWRPISEAV